MHNIILVEDNLNYQTIYSETFKEYEPQITVAKKFRNELEAITYLETNRKSVHGVVTDLRIHAGPNQLFNPPLDTALPYGIQLLRHMSEASLDSIPVIAYSQYLGKSRGSPSPTLLASQKAKADFPFLLDVVDTEPNPNSFVAKIVRTFLYHWNR